jgi:hypothetical protein
MRKLHREYRSLAKPRQFQKFLSGNGVLAKRQEIAAAYQYDWHARKLTFESHFRGHVLMQATAYRSTRDHQWAASHDALFAANGAAVEISVSGLAQANRNRPLEPLLELLPLVMDAVGDLPNRRLRQLDKTTWQGIVALLQHTDLIDAMTIELPPKLRKWAQGKFEHTSALKLQLRLDGWSGAFRHILLTPEPGVDTQYLPELLGDLEAQRGQIFVFDAGYWKIDYYHRIADSHNDFVTKFPGRVKPHPVKDLPLPEGSLASGYQVLRDQLVSLGERSDRLYRLLDVRQTSGQEIRLLSSLLELPADQICLLYRYRWTIEIVFRWLQQILELDHIQSHDPAGVLRQILTALIVWGLLVIANQESGQLSPKQLWRQIYADMHQAVLDLGYRLGFDDALALSHE